jgi:hypothetical protein
MRDPTSLVKWNLVNLITGIMLNYNQSISLPDEQISVARPEALTNCVVEDSSHTGCHAVSTVKLSPTCEIKKNRCHYFNFIPISTNKIEIVTSVDIMFI